MMRNELGKKIGAHTSLLLLLASLGGTGCDGGGVPCTTESLPTVYVVVEDGSGTLVTADPDLQVEYRTAADNWDGCFRDPDQFACGVELQHLWVRATLNGRTSDEIEVQLEMDEHNCHPIWRELTIVLPSEQ